ncbi:Cyclin-dependent kinase 10 like protein [Argiope bruennichi]|uniref:Cyclin-dependent kinase 10 like protein n=1 Tax=Argiope bruennichi TaxID=94029 RepID=A0A8T0ELR2_ARGBR|nr:Cyclin-dependent kinase 10 like protein [Argiope bruennichi]
MTTVSIPELDTGPVDEIATTSEVSGIKLMPSKCKPYMVPPSIEFEKFLPITEFENISFIGEGAYGSVYAGLPVNFTREINTLKQLKHDNIANLLGVAVDRDFENIYLVLEYCPYELSKAIDDGLIQSLINEAHIKCIMYQLFTGLHFLHEKLVLHRDLTGTNILFTEKGVLKITDFGSCRQASKEKMTPNMVSRWYRAPELLFGAENYSSAIDIWSAGCIFAELLNKRPLFETDSDNNMISMLVDLLGIPTETNWPGCSELPLLKEYELQGHPYNNLRLMFLEQSSVCMDLLYKLFTYNPIKRITAQECLVHSYFTENPKACDLKTLVALLKKVDTIY